MGGNITFRNKVNSWTENHPKLAASIKLALYPLVTSTTFGAADFLLSYMVIKESLAFSIPMGLVPGILLAILNYKPKSSGGAAQAQHLQRIINDQGALIEFQTDEIKGLRDKSGEKPKFINQYDPITKLGGGSQGIVYLVKHRVTEKLMVLKVPALRDAIKFYGGNLAIFLSRFKTEAKNISKLNHENIVEFYTYDEMDLDTYNRLTGENIKPIETEKITMFPYLVYEWLEGETLAEKLAEAQGIGLKSFPLSWAAEKMAMLASALKAMQKAEIIHRDIKLANLFLTKAQILKLFDFGIARGVAGTGTQAGSVMGTNIYMAPEQMGGLAVLVLQETFRIPKDEVAVSTKSDLYSSGVTFWEMITGEPPFEPIKQFGDRVELQNFMKSPTPEIIGKLKEMDHELVMDLALLYKKIPEKSKNEHTKETFKGLKSKQGDLLLLLRKIFSRTLAKDPRRRYSDPEEFRVDLLNFIGDYQKYQNDLALLMRLIPAAHEADAVRP